MKHLFSFYICSGQHHQLGQLAQRTGLPMAEHLRLALAWWVASGCVSGRVA